MNNGPLVQRHVLRQKGLIPLVQLLLHGLHVLVGMEMLGPRRNGRPGEELLLADHAGVPCAAHGAADDVDAFFEGGAGEVFEEGGGAFVEDVVEEVGLAEDEGAVGGGFAAGAACWIGVVTVAVVVIVRVVIVSNGSRNDKVGGRSGGLAGMRAVNVNERLTQQSRQERLNGAADLGAGSKLSVAAVAVGLVHRIAGGGFVGFLLWFDLRRRLVDDKIIFCVLACFVSKAKNVPPSHTPPGLAKYATTIFLIPTTNFLIPTTNFLIPTTNKKFVVTNKKFVVEKKKFVVAIFSEAEKVRAPFSQKLTEITYEEVCT